MKIPATAEGVPAIQAMIAEGRSINVTLIFSLARYAEVIDAYLAGLETLAERRRRPVDGAQRGVVLRQPGRHRGRPSPGGHRHRRGAGAARPGRGRPGQARLPAVPRPLRRRSGGSGWPARGAQVQRPLWASTSTKNPAYPDTLYVDSLIGPDTVNTLPEATIAAFEDHGTLARTIDTGVDDAGDGDAPAGRGRRRHGRRRPHPRGPGRRQLPPVVPPRAPGPRAPRRASSAPR